MFDKIYDICDPTEKEISCQCGEVLIKMSHGRPRRVMECCCVDCYQHLEWASVMGGPKVPIVPTLSYWDNDIDVVRGEEHLRVVLLREDGRSKRTTATCCFSTLMVDHPGYNVLCSCFLRKPVGFKMMILMFLQRKPDLPNPGYILRTLILLVENYLNSVATPVESIKPVVRNISMDGTASLRQHWKIHQEKKFSHCLRGFLK